jgi:hypothetical protein
MDIQEDTWIAIDMRAPLGKPDSRWTLTVTTPNKPPREFQDLKCDPEWKQARWIGITSLADRNVSFYLDDVEMGVSH